MRKQEWKILILAVLFRIAVYLLSVCVMAILGQYPDGITFPDFLESWRRWDSVHYINIAQNGYMGAVEDGKHLCLVFYPLYPWLMRALALLLQDFRLCGILISTACYAVGCVFFYKITRIETDAKTAEHALVLISVFPFAFFFGSVATESLFFAIGAALFYYIRTHRWGRVALLGTLACMTKVQGLLFAFAVLAELLHHERGFLLLRNRNWKAIALKILLPGCLCALMLSGFLVYLLVNYHVEGDPFRFLYYLRSHWHQQLAPLWETVPAIFWRAARSWRTSVGMSLWVPESLLFPAYLGVIAYGFRRKLRPMYMVYLIAFFLLTYSCTFLLSAGRYTLSNLPVFMLAGGWAARHEKARMPAVIFSAMLMMIYMIGFWEWKQIM